MKDMHTTIPSPIGPLRLTVADDGALTRVDFGAGDVSDDPRFAAAAAQLGEYFAGQRTAFDLPMRAHGTAFEQLVWAELLRIPYGETASYADIAARIGHPGKARAVGLANARNPLAIVCPCHRVIGSDGSLTGYAGGLASKRALLALEAGALSLL
ncbi:MAG TPA: methylated-DNA--[protein]-cysteine S-methyltransferase [Solirubrobacteraceae bacterium]